jgi:5-methylcytosine-specific restriction enzyme subunit McrC
MDGTTHRRTYALTERQPANCRLGRADIDFLLAVHRDHVELAPSGRRGWYRLTPLGHVGTIVGPGCRLLIRPKIPVENLFYLLDPTTPLPTVEDRTQTLSAEGPLDFLAGRLAQLLAERGAAGLHRSYAERAEQGPFLHGRLDLPAALREPAGRKDRIPCRFEEFTVDVPCNRVPKATAELVLRSPLLDERVRAVLTGALRGFSEVGSIDLTPEGFAAAEPTRLTEAYRPLIDLCRLLVDGLAPTQSAGATPYPAFLLNMERVFERYLTHGVRRAFAEDDRYTVAGQALCTVSASRPGQPDLEMRPDLMVERGGRPVVVVDAKWKRLRRAPEPADMYQVLAYCTVLGVRRGVLVYPGRRDRVRRYVLPRSPVRLEVCTLRVSGPREECALSLQGLAARFGRARGPRSPETSG